MATATNNTGARPGGYHQDYIARVRYSNALPAPDMPPRLLNIPGEGLSGGQYATPSFASRLAREQPINIEADAELGMHIDLVGMPGIFDGDESSIQAPDRVPAPHPHDKPLLRPLASLGKPTNSSVSFLRRTEYISSEQHRSRGEHNSPHRSSRPDEMALRKRRRDAAELDEPINILRETQKGFELADPVEVYTGKDSDDKVRAAPLTPAERAAWSNVQHPSNKRLKPIDFYPLLPDLEAFPDSGGYVMFTFNASPLPSQEAYDERIDIGIFRPKNPARPEVMDIYQEAMTAFDADPMNRTHPGAPPFDYDFYVPSDRAMTANVRAKLDTDNPHRHDPALYGPSMDDGEPSFRYGRVRSYATSAGTKNHSKYKEVVLTLHDGPEGDDSHSRKQKAAYYYPVLQKTTVRPRRIIQPAQAGMMGSQQQSQAAVDEDKIDRLDVVLNEPTAAERERRQGHKREVVEGPADDEEDGEVDADAAGEEE